jgi:hypothetical protein
MEKQPVIVFYLTLDETNTILGFLGKGIYEDVAPLIQKIHGQAMPQLKQATPIPETQPTPDMTADDIHFGEPGGGYSDDLVQEQVQDDLETEAMPEDIHIVDITCEVEGPTPCEQVEDVVPCEEVESKWEDAAQNYVEKR